MKKRYMYICDLVNPDTGKTYRQENAEKQHNIPIGTLVEIGGSGVRLFVVNHGRDCDMTPLYYFCYDKDNAEVERKGFINRKWTGGYPEEGLSIIKEV